MTPVADNSMTRRQLLEAMRRMRSLVEADENIPDAEPMDWTVPHRLNRDSRETLGLFAAKLAGCLERCLSGLSGMTFEVKAAGVYERYAGQLYAQVLQDQPQMYYLSVLQAGGKNQAGFVRLPFETATLLIGCVLRDPDLQVGENGQLTSLAESILLDAVATVAEAFGEGFDEYGHTTIEKTEQLVFVDWPVRFHDLEDLCEFRFEAVCSAGNLSLDLVVRDDAIADIAQLTGPFARAEEKKENSDRIVKRMHETPMQVTAQLSSSLMTLNDVLSLEPGDVVVLDRKTGEPIDVLVNGQACFSAWPAASAGRMALQVADGTAGSG